MDVTSIVTLILFTLVCITIELVTSVDVKLVQFISVDII